MMEQVQNPAKQHPTKISLHREHSRLIEVITKIYLLPVKTPSFQYTLLWFFSVYLYKSGYLSSCTGCIAVWGLIRLLTQLLSKTCLLYEFMYFFPTECFFSAFKDTSFKVSCDYGTGNSVFIEHLRKGMKKINNDSKIVKTKHVK